MKRVFVLDDNDVSLKLISAVLKLREYDVLEERCPHAAVSGAGKAAADLFILDIQMPGLSGVEVLKKLRAMPELENVPIVATSAYADETDSARFLEEGFDAFIPKPLSIPDVYDCISSMFVTRQEAGAV